MHSDPRAHAEPTAPISVLVVEDDAAMRQEFMHMVRQTPGFALWGVAESLAAARTLLAHGPGRDGSRPDVAVIDLGLPDGDGTVLIRELNEPGGRTSVLVATVFGDELHVVRAIESGARGYLLKDSPIGDFARSIRLVCQGEAPLSPQVASHLLKRFVPPLASQRPRQPGAEGEPLTTREAEILTLIARGHSVAEVAQQLHLSPHTVGTHVKRIYDKLAVSNRVQAVNRAREMGQIS